MTAKITKQDVLKDLNNEQKQPVIFYKGPQFIIAGPGAGKTKTIVARTQYMILDGVNPSNILIFTFTNKAAKEIKERISQAIGPKASKITMGTYHSFCCRILRKYATKLGYISNQFTIFDADDSKKIVKDILAKNLDEGAFISYVSRMKHSMISPSMAMQNAANNNDPFAMYYDLYQKELKAQNSMDFDDLIYNAIRVLENNPDVLEKINNKYKYISSDESQDSSPYDLRLMRLLAGTKHNICFMLDEDQSIYGFRGADINSVINIRKIYNNFKTYVLSTNYRSTANIVDGSRSLIAHNPKLIEKNIVSNNDKGNKIMCLEEASAGYEAVRVAKLITSLHIKYKIPYKEMAVLYRTSGQSRAVEDMLLKYKIPYDVLSGTNFYSRKEIKDLTSFVFFLVNPYNIERFSRIVNIPKGGIGSKTIEKIVDESRNDVEAVDLISAAEKLLEKGEIKGKAVASLRRFLDNYYILKKCMDDMTIAELLAKIIKLTDYYNFMHDENPEDYDDRCSNVIELIELADEFDTLEEFIDQTCINRKDDGETADKVSLLTMHMSKG